MDNKREQVEAGETGTGSRSSAAAMPSETGVVGGVVLRVGVGVTEGLGLGVDEKERRGGAEEAKGEGEGAGVGVGAEEAEGSSFLAEGSGCEAPSSAAFTRLWRREQIERIGHRYQCMRYTYEGGLAIKL